MSVAAPLRVIAPEPSPAGSPLVEIVIPVHNEERDLGPSVHRLHAYLDEAFPFPTRITIADNASTDRTRAIGLRLADELPGVDYVRLQAKGRGLALAATWLGSDAMVLAYMDVDLSTDLDALLPLVAPLISGHSALAIGSRLARGARVRRGVRRELISRSYNLILRLTLGVRCRDAQCGFKAIRADVARRLVPRVKNRNWFFDTELLVLAEREGLRITELPVDWTDDTDSRVRVAATAIEDLRGVIRLLVSRGGPHRLLRFAGVGGLSTLAYAGLYWWLRGVTSVSVANVSALLVTAVANTAVNRRFTFGVSGRAGIWSDQAAGLIAFGIALLMTEAASWLLSTLAPQAGRLVEVAVLTAANVAATLVRFLVLRGWLGSERRRPVPPARGADAPR
ncbi:MAG TPA: glycosyltransferase [Candidatus Binatia bacterium]|nr:glycosyltransferase [Candidatus Binatia bacterium]